MSTEAHDTGKEVDGTQVDKVNAGALGTLVAVGLLAMISITAAVTALVRHDLDVAESEKAADANQVVISLKDSQRGVLNSPAHYADSKGTVALPIDLAKGLVLSELSKDPNSATPAPPPKADAGSTATTTETADAGVTSTDAGAKAEPASKAEPAKEKEAEPKPAPASSAKPVPATSAKPAPASSAPAAMPKPTPTAATPGAESPGPVNH